MQTGTRVLVVDTKTNDGLWYGRVEYLLIGWIGVRDEAGRLDEVPAEAVCEAAQQ